MAFKSAVVSIRDSPWRNNDGKFGFTIYRVTYGNDEDFARFLELLTAHLHARLDRDKNGHEIKDFLHWDVRDNESELSNATINDVRQYVLVPSTKGFKEC